VFRVIEGDVTLTDSLGEPLATISGSEGSILKVSGDFESETTITGTIQVEEQNLDSNGYIRNSSHNMGQYNSNWMPFALDSQGRLRISNEAGPHTLSGTDHIGVLSNSQIPFYITRDTELNTVSGVLDNKIQNKPDTFLELDDTFNSYTDHAEKLLFVNSAENGVVCSGIIDGGYF